MASVYGYKKIRYRYGHPKYKEWFDTYTAHLSWSEDQLREFQWAAVQETLKHAFETVPFYRERAKEQGMSWLDIRDPSDMAKLPYVTKDDIRNRGTELLSDTFEESEYESIPTSGSTGKPLTLYCHREATFVIMRCVGLSVGRVSNAA